MLGNHWLSQNKRGGFSQWKEQPRLLKVDH